MATTVTTATPNPEPPQAALLALMWLASPALPVGGFSYSEGLEAAVDAGRVTNEASTLRWLTEQLMLGLARGDLAVVALAATACRAQDWAAVRQLDTWVRTTRESAELRLQTEQMGRSLVDWLRSLRVHDASLAQLPADLLPLTYPVAYALALQCRLPEGAPVAPGLTAYAFAWAENQVQAALKAVPLGQSAGQRIVLALSNAIPAAVAHAEGLRFDRLQTYTPMLAILSSRHEVQYSRLFRS